MSDFFLGSETSPLKENCLKTLKYMLIRNLLIKKRTMGYALRAFMIFHVEYFAFIVFLTIRQVSSITDF